MLPKAPHVVLLPFLLYNVIYPATGISTRPRRRRDLLDLADMFDIWAGLDPTDYIPYGNWCGYGGQGNPIDLIDKCCQVHDDCYDAAEKICPGEMIHLVQYNWRVENDTVVCEDESICESSVCTCDKEVVECIATHNHTYSDEYRFIKDFGLETMTI